MERFTLQSQLDAVLPQLARAHVELEDAEAQDPGALPTPLPDGVDNRAPKVRPQTRRTNVMIDNTSHDESQIAVVFAGSSRRAQGFRAPEL
jgi:hypothetical protein